MAFKCVSHIKEDHGNQIFGVKFNEFLEDERTFATVGSNRVTVYRCQEDGTIKPLQAYNDANSEECYYTCTWSINKDNCHSLLVVAGALGILRVINTSTVASWKSYCGHGNAINELKTHPLIPQLVLSASKDHSLRLWNIQTDVCVAIFGGVDGHRDEVLGTDFHMLGGSIVSCGMDHSLKVWQLDTSEIKDAIEASEQHSARSNKNFPTLRCHFPAFSTREVHSNYVDSVCYFGNTILSKSCENKVVWWKPVLQLSPDTTPTSSSQPLPPVSSSSSSVSGDSVVALRSLEVQLCEIWFMKMCLNERLGLLALGNQIGKVTLWDMTIDDPIKSKHIVCGCDNATIWLWDHKTVGDYATAK
ncbi:polycomb protein eed-like isoform X2 [Dysidea avara]|uniref:polycomb protein eed-like isoform X2 n=1 Tax=Dysidea avara TaxID=196820 RepID=UPI00331B62BC